LCRVGTVAARADFEACALRCKGKPTAALPLYESWRVDFIFHFASSIIPVWQLQQYLFPT
jgi:hypothetical protein